MQFSNLTAVNLNSFKFPKFGFEVRSSEIKVVLGFIYATTKKEDS